MAIQSIKCSKTKELFETGSSKPFGNFAKTATRKLQMLDSAMTLDFLKSPPGNELELLVGNRAGQHSIRINKQFRICFVWTDLGPTDLEIVDYH